MTDVAHGQTNESINDLASTPPGTASSSQGYLIHSAWNAEAPRRYWEAGFAFGFQSSSTSQRETRPGRSFDSLVEQMRSVQARIPAGETEPGALDDLAAEMSELDDARRRATAAALGNDER